MYEVGDLLTLFYKIHWEINLSLRRSGQEKYRYEFDFLVKRLSDNVTQLWQVLKLLYGQPHS
jgi:hypothetical protein